MQFGDLNNILQQTKANIEKMQEEARKQTVEGSAGGGKVIATVNGQQELIKIKIDPEVVDPDPDEISLLEDMIVAAVNQATQKSRVVMQEQMGQQIAGAAGGLDLNNLMDMFKPK